MAEASPSSNRLERIEQILLLPWREIVDFARSNVEKTIEIKTLRRDSLKYRYHFKQQRILATKRQRQLEKYLRSSNKWHQLFIQKRSLAAKQERRIALLERRANNQADRIATLKQFLGAVQSSRNLYLDFLIRNRVFLNKTITDLRSELSRLADNIQGIYHGGLNGEVPDASEHADTVDGAEDRAEAVARLSRMLDELSTTIYSEINALNGAVTVNFTAGGTAKPWMSYLDRTFVFADRCLDALGEQRFDIVLCHDHPALQAGAEIAERSRAPLIYDAVEIPSLRHLAGPMAQRYLASPRGIEAIDRVESALIEKSAALLTVSHGLGGWLAENTRAPQATVVRNCREYEDVASDGAIRADCGLAKGDTLVLFFNTVYEGQGFEQAVESLAYLPDEVHLATLGPLPARDYRDELETMAGNLGVLRRVHFLEPKPSSEMIRFAAGADISIIPRQATSLNNVISLPNRVFESVMARLPIAVADLPDMRRIVDEHGIGQAFDQTDPASIASAITAIREKLAQSDYAETLERAAQSLCWETERQQLLGVVDGLAPQRGAQSIAIVANKNISSNNRLYRFAGTLHDAGYAVTVVAPVIPDEDLLIDDVTYIEA